METLHIYIIALLSIGISLMAIKLDEEREEYYIHKYTTKKLLLFFILRIVVVFTFITIGTKLFIN